MRLVPDPLVPVIVTRPPAQFVCAVKLAVSTLAAVVLLKLMELGAKFTLTHAGPLDWKDTFPLKPYSGVTAILIFGFWFAELMVTDPGAAVTMEKSGLPTMVRVMESVTGATAGSPTGLPVIVSW
jgi:hypothetical protein